MVFVKLYQTQSTGVQDFEHWRAELMNQCAPALQRIYAQRAITWSSAARPAAMAPESR
jgi:hypothetical protein